MEMPDSRHTGEKHMRSLAKAASWRAIGTMDTMLVAFVVTGQPALSAAIGGIEVITKIFLFWLHERAWLMLIAAKWSHIRSVAKAFSWRVVGSIDTFVIAFVLSGHFKISLSISGVEVFTKIFLFWIHERLWLRIRWGRR